MDLESTMLDHSNSSRLCERLVATDAARRFFNEVVNLVRKGFELLELRCPEGRSLLSNATPEALHVLISKIVA